MRVKITAEAENKQRLLRPYKQKILYANSLEHPVRFLPRLEGGCGGVWVGWGGTLYVSPALRLMCAQS